MTAPLRRRGMAAAPVRQVHLGLGAFFRAHQADYTERCGAAEGWGIAAFAGHSPGLADRLTAQDGLYTLVQRGADRDRSGVIHSLSRAHRADDGPAWAGYFADPDVSVVTLTVTEAAYLGGRIDGNRTDVRADLARLGARERDGLTTVPGRLLAGLTARRDADAGPITLLPCDNLPANGAVLDAALRGMAELADPALVDWIGRSVSVASSLVDRITPASTPADVDLVQAATGYRDECPVITEPYREWVISGAFNAPRPPWERAGALFTDELLPYEQRKLWLLNGAHSLLAYVAPLRGHRTVAAAIEDSVVLDWVEQWWREAGTHLAFPRDEVTGYCDQLLTRFANARIEHRLAQIAADGSVKLPARILPVVSMERARNRMPHGAVRALAGWVLHLRGEGVPVRDAGSDELVAQMRSESLGAAAGSALRYLDARLGDDAALVSAMTELAGELSGREST